MNKKILAIIAIIIIVVCILFKLFSKETNAKSFDMQDEVKVAENNCSMIVNSVENVEIDNWLYEGEYVKVNLSVTNNNNTNITLPTLFFSIVNSADSSIGATIISENTISGVLPSEISSGQTISGDLYFKTNLENGMKLKYSAPINVKETGDGNISYDTVDYLINLN